MKFFMVLLAIVACVSADGEWKPKTAEEMKTIRSACLEEHPLTEEQLGHMKTFDFPNEEAVRKFLVCTAVKLGVLCTHEGYNADRIAKQFKGTIEESDIKTVAEDCISKHPKGDKEIDVYAYEVHSCLMDSEIGQKLKATVKKHQE